MNMHTMAFLPESPIAIFVLLLIALLFFGHKLPSLAKSLGSSVSEFKKGVKEGEEEANSTTAAKVATPEKKDAISEEKK